MRIEYINIIAIFVNRILYAIYEVWVFMERFFSWIVNNTLGRLLYSIPFIRKRINKREGVDDYQALIKKFETPSCAFRYNKLSLFIFFLPISLFLNIATIVIGNPVKLLYTKSVIFLPLFISITMLLSFLLDNYFFWNKDKYLTFFPAFKKESLLKRIAWIIGTFASLGLLLVLNMKLFCYIINAH